MSEIKSALDSISQPIQVEAPSKKNIVEVKNNIITPAQASKKSQEQRSEKQKLALEKARETKKAKALANPTGKTVLKKTALFQGKIDQLDHLGSIIEKLDIIEDRLGLKIPIKVNEYEPIKMEKEPETIKPPESQKAEENIKNKDPLKVDDRIKPEDTIKPPDIHKVFEGYNVRKFTSLHQVPIIKKKKY